MKFELEEGLEDIISISIVFPGEVIATLVAHESIAVILVLGNPDLYCRCKIVERGIAEEDLPYSRRDVV